MGSAGHGKRDQAAAGGGKGGKGVEPRALSAAKLPVADLPAHIRKQLEQAMEFQVAEAATKIVATAKAVTDEARSAFMATAASVCGNRLSA